MDTQSKDQENKEAGEESVSLPPSAQLGERGRIIVNCGCGRRLKVPSFSSGKQITCPGCRQLVDVPVVEKVPPDSIQCTPKQKESQVQAEDKNFHVPSKVGLIVFILIVRYISRHGPIYELYPFMSAMNLLAVLLLFAISTCIVIYAIVIIAAASVSTGPEDALSSPCAIGQKAGSKISGIKKHYKYSWALKTFEYIFVFLLFVFMNLCTSAFFHGPIRSGRVVDIIHPYGPRLSLSQFGRSPNVNDSAKLPSPWLIQRQVGQTIKALVRVEVDDKQVFEVSLDNARKPLRLGDIVYLDMEAGSVPGIFKGTPVIYDSPHAFIISRRLWFDLSILSAVLLYSLACLLLIVIVYPITFITWQRAKRK